jgi:hypothetical protein
LGADALARLITPLLGVTATKTTKRIMRMGMGMGRRRRRTTTRKTTSTRPR